MTADQATLRRSRVLRSVLVIIDVQEWMVHVDPLSVTGVDSEAAHAAALHWLRHTDGVTEGPLISRDLNDS